MPFQMRRMIRNRKVADAAKLVVLGMAAWSLGLLIALGFGLVATPLIPSGVKIVDRFALPGTYQYMHERSEIVVDGEDYIPTYQLSIHPSEVGMLDELNAALAASGVDAVYTFELFRANGEIAWDNILTLRFQVWVSVADIPKFFHALPQGWGEHEDFDDPPPLRWDTSTG